MFLTFVLIIFSITIINGKLDVPRPPHCTTVTKDTDFSSRYKFVYPESYIPPGQHEAFQQLFCLNPPELNKAVTTVCDWSAPPRVQFTIGDEYMHVVRQDPTGRFQGNAVINTYQLCSHNVSYVSSVTDVPTFSEPHVNQL